MSEDQTHALEPLEDDATTGQVESSIASELRALGERLTAAVRAAATTEEATALGNDVRENVRRLRVELEDAMRRVPEMARRGGEAATAEANEVATTATNTVGGGVQMLRREVGAAIAALGRTLERLGSALHVDGDAIVDATPPVESSADQESA